MKLLDLFSGAGGAAMGYYRAGFTEILGIDIAPQPRYPFSFVQADALEFLAGLGPGEYDLIHASPPCQQYSRARVLHGRCYPDLAEPVRLALRAAGMPYVIENVVGAPLIDAVCLCGMMFGLKVFRHRLFESSEFLLQPPHVKHGERRIGRGGFCCPAGHGDSGRARIPSDHRRVDVWRQAMDIPWMTRDELAQAVPPAYTEFCGGQILPGLRAEVEGLAVT